LIAWVSRFLWHYEGVCSGYGAEEVPDEPAKTIVENIFKAVNIVDCKDKMKIEPIGLPNPAFYFQHQDIHQE